MRSARPGFFAAFQGLPVAFHDPFDLGSGDEAPIAARPPARPVPIPRHKTDRPPLALPKHKRQRPISLCHQLLAFEDRKGRRRRRLTDPIPGPAVFHDKPAFPVRIAWPDALEFLGIVIHSPFAARPRSASRVNASSASNPARAESTATLVRFHSNEVAESTPSPSLCHRLAPASVKRTRST